MAQQSDQNIALTEASSQTSKQRDSNKITRNMSSGDQKEKDTTSEIVNRTKSEADHQNEGIYKMCTYI